VEDDFSEYHNLAEKEPEKLRKMIDLWWVEASRQGVLPLDDRVAELFPMSRFRPNRPHREGRYVYYPPISHIPIDAAPQMGFRDWMMTADVERTDASDDGVILASGGQTAGFSWYIRDGEVVFDSNISTEHRTVSSDRKLPVGSCALGVRFMWEDKKGILVLLIDGEECGTMELPSPLRAGSTGLSIGRDNLSPVTDDYEAPFPFSGTIRKVEVHHQEYRTASAEKADARARFRAEMARQ
jgi:hypothetical protein